MRIKLPALGSVAQPAAHLLIPLAVGFVLYLLWRPTNLWMFVWLDWLGLSEIVFEARRAVAGVSTFIPSVVLYNLPAAFWCYSFCVAIGLIWKDASFVQWRLAVLAALAVGIAGEVVQLVPSVPGVFDIADCAADTVASVAGIVVVSRFRGQT